jgi:hypothetical protein
MEPDLRYPVGKFESTGPLNSEQRGRLIDQIEATPANLRAAVQGLNDEQLATPYRPGGWTVRQVVHHIPDSHINSYMRFKLALTEELPTIRTYDEARWAELEDGRNAPIEVSLNLLESLHRRWVLLLRSLKGEDLERSFQHPEWGKVGIDWALQMYAWHGRHHVAHITSLRDREGWN